METWLKKHFDIVELEDDEGGTYEAFRFTAPSGLPATVSIETFKEMFGTRAPGSAEELKGRLDNEAWHRIIDTWNVFNG